LAVIESLAHGALREANGAPIVATLHAPDARAILCAPMIADAGALGVIVLASARAEMFAPQETRLVAAIARQAALLAENARLYTQLEHHAILAERGRLAREMHDGLAQTLGLLKMRASQIARWIENGEAERARDALRELAETANDAYRDLRATLDDLRATDADLPAQIRRIVAEFEQDCAATVILTLEDLPPLDLSAQAHLIRIVQESLTNIRKHARARQVRIALTNQEGRAELTIEDDGQGFDAARDQPATRHGLRVMRERADLLGAEFQIVSAPGEGTRVRLELPVSVGQISNLPL
jgi:two-component system nitrate/nitrite sensor histidine kinase NarX